MKQRQILLAVLICFAGFTPTQGTARILSVTPIEGNPGKIIAAPPQALDSAVASATHMLGFDERQNVLLTQDLKVDEGVITKGTRVNSHMILYNLPDEEFGSFAANEWIFAGEVIAVMSDTDGTLEAASNKLLGAPGTIYPTNNLFLRGFEENDGYEGVGTSRLRVWMSVWQPGDWIRVLTRPAPSVHYPGKPSSQPQLARNPVEPIPQRKRHDTVP